MSKHGYWTSWSYSENFCNKKSPAALHMEKGNVGSLQAQGQARVMFIINSFVKSKESLGAEKMSFKAL